MYNIPLVITIAFFTTTVWAIDSSSNDYFGDLLPEEIAELYPDNDLLPEEILGEEVVEDDIGICEVDVIPSCVPQGEFINSSTGERVKWVCEMSQPPGSGWVDVGNCCYHKVIEAKPYASHIPSCATRGEFTANTGEVTMWVCGMNLSPGFDWVDVGAGCYHLVKTVVIK